MESDRLDQVLIVLLVCLSQGDGGMANMICDFSLDVNEDGKVTLLKTRLIHRGLVQTTFSLPIETHEISSTPARTQVDQSDDIHDMGFFEAILSKDAVFYLATDSVVAPLITAIECDEVFGGRR